MSNSSLEITDIDFNGIKTSLKTYLRSQDTFKDYDFEGSSMSVLLDVLAYNSYKNAFLLNMLFSESWLDSAQLRASILSRAKELNYLTSSKKSARAKISCSFTAIGTSQPYVIQKGSSFSALVKSTSQVFSIPETITVASINSSFSFTTDLYEGVYLKDSYVYNTNTPNHRFRISNQNVDIASLAVKVFEDNKLLADTYTQATTLLNINENSKIYFIQASDNGYYEIIFGDGVLGYKPKDNSVIILDYRISNDIQPNGAAVFSINFDPTGQSSELVGNINVTTIEAASGGADVESLDSVKYYAPRHFQVQERAVVATDYEILLKQAFNEINAISVIGGEDMIPAQYGKIFISVDIANVQGFPDSKKKQYADFINRKMNLSIRPQFISPEYTYYSIAGIVRYNQNVTSASQERIKSLAIAAINAYDKSNLNDFNVTLRKSVLTDSINDCDPSVISNNLVIKIYKKLQPDINISQNIKINFGVSLTPATLITSFFTYNGLQCFIQDDELGTLSIFSRNSDTINRIVSIGTVKYDTGEIFLNNLTIQSFDGLFLKIYTQTADFDVAVAKNNILQLEQDEVSVIAESLRI